VAGHSVGEVAAAHVAGVFSLEDACQLVSARARLMEALPDGGAMTAVRASEEDVRGRLVEGVSVAAVNGPRSVVIAGDEKAVDEVACHWESTRLPVSHAFHSAHMDPMLDEFASVVRRLTFHAPRVPLAAATSNGTAEQITSPEYWVRHVRETVRFADAVSGLGERGATAFVEIGPDGALSALVAESATAGSLTVPLLRKDRDEETTLVTALARLHTAGVSVDWDAFFDGTGAHAVDLPTYAFQHRRFWPEHMPHPGAASPARNGIGGGAPASTDDAFWEAVGREDFGSLESVLRVEQDSLAQVLPALLEWRRHQQDQSVVDSWRHRILWKPLQHPAGSPGGRWLAVVPAGTGDEESLSAVLDAAGAHGTEIQRVETAASDREEMARVLRAAARPAHGDSAAGNGSAASNGSSGHDAPAHYDGVLSLLALTPGTSDGAAPEGTVRTAVLLQALGDAGITAPLWCATRGAVSVARSETVEAPEQAAVWGLGRVAALEYPDRWGGLIDLPAVLDAASADRLAPVLRAAEGENQVAVRAGAVYGRRVTPEPAPDPERTWQPHGTVLITGGTGALGGHVARTLARRGADHLVLASRRGMAAPGAEELRAELLRTGVGVSVIACDVSDRESLRSLLASVPDEHPLTGVVHTAGVLDDGVLDRLTPDRFTEVFRSKVRSAVLLDELTREEDLSAFVLFSSASSAMGNPGQGNYAAANAVLDALAEDRRARGLPATSIAWGAWGGGGMAGGADAERQARHAGVLAMDPELACAALMQLAAESAPTAMVAAVDTART
ncbi:SDR family NAD(P)-dependent oxidoreductase, partial [Streptomyces nanshensis]